MKKLLALTIALLFSLSTLTQAHSRIPVLASDTTKHLKKDGTPDKRFKASKTPKGPLKKDGTPDKRYKANKKS